MSATALIHLLRAPKGAGRVSPEQWNGVVEEARRQQMLGQLAVMLREVGVWEQIHAPVQRHLALAELTALRRREAALWELKGMRRAIDAAIPIIVLKGCAYAVADDANAPGRLFSDVDLMVRRSDLDAVEGALISVGWKPSRVNAYDMAYYRNWMHEVPPMEHVRRHTVCDLHHAINPPVSRYYIRPERLFEQAVEVLPGILVLCPTDRIIHCALHLLQEGEPKKLLRDLFDLFLLLRQHNASDANHRALLARADALGVGAPVRAALSAAQRLFGPDAPPLPASNVWISRQVERAARSQPGLATALADTAVLAHSHWMKMPWRLLAPHLARKTWLGWFPEKER